MAMRDPYHDDPRWAALAARDPAFDGVFVFAVRSTGIYCQPSCPARRPKPENVAFYDSPALARAAGFRACKRCHPDGADKGAVVVAEACRKMAATQAQIPLAKLAAEAGLSFGHFHKLFKSLTGVTPKDWARAERAARLRLALHQPGVSVTSALYEAGFEAQSRLYAEADRHLGMAPKRFQKHGEATEIVFDMAQTALGWLLVARSARGICAVSLGDEPSALEAELRAMFHKAHLRRGGAEFKAEIAAVIAAVTAPARAVALPLDLQGTAFQMRVWQALREIPAGERVSYQALAERVGAPKAARAVASACAANRVAVLVPCHRVVRGTGELSGYRWGVARKAALLAREAGEEPRGS